MEISSASASSMVSVPLRKPVPGVESVSDEAEHPLTFSQERMWFLNQIDPEGVEGRLGRTFHVPVAVRRVPEGALPRSKRKSRRFCHIQS